MAALQIDDALLHSIARVLFVYIAFYAATMVIQVRVCVCVCVCVCVLRRAPPPIGWRRRRRTLPRSRPSTKQTTKSKGRAKLGFLAADLKAKKKFSRHGDARMLPYDRLVGNTLEWLPVFVPTFAGSMLATGGATLPFGWAYVATRVS